MHPQLIADTLEPHRPAYPGEATTLESLDTARASHHAEQGRWLRIAEWALIVFLAAQFGVRTLPGAWRTLNTDFPNYYLTARLVREHYDTSRIYEWRWFERQKDHRDIDQRVVGMVPITPFSTLAVYPLTSLTPLTAKRCWIVINLGLLLAALYLLRAATQISWRRLVLIAALSYPLRVNLTYGQYYVLLLFLLALAYWLYTRASRFSSGIAVGLAAGLKVFPVIFLLYFLRKKDWKALLGGAAGALFSAAISLLVFGWSLNRVYLFQVLPATFRGEVLDPYNLKLGSIASLLHRLFIYEPLSNLHPALNAPALFAILHPLLQMAILAPALLLAVPRDTRPRQLHLEWAAIVFASLALSTSPSTYLFTILILPICLLLASLQPKNYTLRAAVLLVLYAATGFVSGTNSAPNGWLALLQMPRLYATILFCVIAYILLLRNRQRERIATGRRDNALWTLALLLILLFNVASGLRHQHGLYAGYPYRVPLPNQVLMASAPAAQADSIHFIAMWGAGYRSAVSHAGDVQLSAISQDDYLTLAAVNDTLWLERAGTHSDIVSTPEGQSIIEQAESPAASPDGRWLGVLREDRGRARIWLHNQPAEADKPLTPPELNVLEMSFRPNGDLIFSAAFNGEPDLYTADRQGNIHPLNINDARYPAVSPNGHWLAYSQLQRGSWNLWLRNLDTGQSQRLTRAACNDIEPAWTADSKTLLYASDCGRALWFTAILKRRIFP